VSNFSCFINDTYISKGICTYKPIRNKFGNFTVAGTLINPIEKPQVGDEVVRFVLEIWNHTVFFFIEKQLEINQYNKGSSNVFHPGQVYLKFDMCQASGRTMDLIFQFFQPMKQIFGKILQTCPYKVLYFNNILFLVQNYNNCSSCFI